MEFKKLSEVQLVEGAVDTANVLIEENGEIKRVPKTEVGGTGFPTVIIEDEQYMQYVEDVHNGTEESSVSPVEAATYSFSGLTFEEAYEELYNGGIINVIFKSLITDLPTVIPGAAIFAGTVVFGLPCIVLSYSIYDNNNDSMYGHFLYWTEDGISEQSPGDMGPS